MDYNRLRRPFRFAGRTELHFYLVDDNLPNLSLHESLQIYNFDKSTIKLFEFSTAILDTSLSDSFPTDNIFVMFYVIFFFWSRNYSWLRNIFLRAPFNLAIRFSSISVVFLPTGPYQKHFVPVTLAEWCQLHKDSCRAQKCRGLLEGIDEISSKREAKERTRPSSRGVEKEREFLESERERKETRKREKETEAEWDGGESKREKENGTWKGNPMNEEIQRKWTNDDVIPAMALFTKHTKVGG